jgi:hypothetical protein
VARLVAPDGAMSTEASVKCKHENNMARIAWKVIQAFFVGPSFIILPFGMV